MINNLIEPYKIILASGSPRRRQLLEEMGVDFVVDTRPVDEVVAENTPPEEAAILLSRLKAGAFPNDYFIPNRIVITADTIVAINNNILGKPAGEQQAIEMLQQLSGKSHLVITGVTLKTATKEKSFFVTTKVIFKQLSIDEIKYYVANYKPFDKAGAYGIQEWIGHVAIEKIEGSYFNVVGLPTHRLYQELMAFVSEPLKNG